MERTLLLKEEWSLWIAPLKRVAVYVNGMQATMRQFQVGTRLPIRLPASVPAALP